MPDLSAVVPHIRWAIHRDMAAILAIENTVQAPWTEDDFCRVLRTRNCVAMVAELANHVCGFIAYELHTHWLRVLNLAVHPDSRRHRVGGCLLDVLIAKLAPDRRTRVVLEVRETNLGAQQFLRSRGFRALRVQRNYYEDTDEAAYEFTYQLFP